jgi:hypothetical protein
VHEVNGPASAHKVMATAELLVALRDESRKIGEAYHGYRSGGIYAISRRVEFSRNLRRHCCSLRAPVRETVERLDLHCPWGSCGQALPRGSHARSLRTFIRFEKFCILLVTRSISLFNSARRGGKNSPFQEMVSLSEGV